MPVLNLDAVAPKTITVERGGGGEGHSWKLRADVPSGILVRCFEVVELEEQRPELEISVEGGQDFALLRAQGERLRAHERAIEAKVLDVLGEVWRWTDPTVTDEWLAETFSPGARRDMLGAFFLILLARSGKLPPAATSGSSSTASPSPSTEPQRQSSPTATAADSPSSKGRGSTRSATRSRRGSSRRKGQPAAELTQPERTTTASGVAASIY